MRAQLNMRRGGWPGQEPAIAVAAAEVSGDLLECLEVADRRGCHFTPDQAWRLMALRRRWQVDGLNEFTDGAAGPATPNRCWEFARWLYKHGRLSG
jgi:hypothetical protein